MRPEDVIDFVANFAAFLFFIFLIVAVIKVIFGWIPSRVYGYWYQPYTDFQHSTYDFYTQLEAKLRDAQIDGIYFKVVHFHEGRWLVTPKRAYLRIVWKDKIMDICAAPFGKAYFFSWWLFEKERLWEKFLLSFPWIGEKIVNFLNPYTYYKIDTANMFQSYVHTIVLELVNELTSGQESQGLKQDIRQPIMKDVFSLRT